MVSFPVRDVTGWELRGVEQRGVTRHPWLVDPADDQLHLWKPSDGSRLVRREHWAEKCAAELAHLLGVPCAEIDMAVRNDVPGCVSRNVVPNHWEIVPGAHLLTAVDADFRPENRGPGKGLTA